MNLIHLSKDQRKFLRLVRDQPDTLDRLIDRLMFKPWRLSMWLRSQVFRDNLAEVLQILRRRRKLELDLAASAGIVTIARLMHDKDASLGQLLAATAAVELEQAYSRPRKAARKSVKMPSAPPRSLVHPDVPEDEAMQHIRSLDPTHRLNQEPRVSSRATQIG